MLNFALITILLFIIGLMVFMGHLSVRMDKRRRKEKYYSFIQDTLGSVWVSGGENFLPVPYLKVETDAYCERLRKKRNFVVALFWVIWILIVVFFIVQ